MTPERPLSETSAAKIGSLMVDLVRGRNSQLSNEIFPSGFYLLCKRMFANSNKGEILICTVNSQSGIKRIKIWVRRNLHQNHDKDSLAVYEQFFSEFDCQVT